MELVYLYIERFGDFIYKQGIQLSNNFEVELKDKKLIVKKRQNYLRNFYGKKIINFSVVAGKNGSGKTTILDVLGMHRHDRLRNSVVSKNVEDEYFLLYYIGNDECGQELYGIEVLGENVLHNMFTNYDSRIDDERYDKSKTSIGKVYKYENDKFISVGSHFFNYSMGGEALSELIRYAYVGEIYRFSNRNEKYGIYNRRDDDYIAERRFVPKPSVYQKYLTLNECIIGEIKGLECDRARIHFGDDIDYYVGYDKSYEKYEDVLKEVEKKLYIWHKISIIKKKEKEETKAERKQNYILDLYSRYIMDMLVKALYPLCEKENVDNAEEDVDCIDIKSYIEYIKNLTARESSEDILGKASGFSEELMRLQILMTELKVEFGTEDKLYFLKVLARYVGSRIHSSLENNEFGYVEAMEKLIECLREIPEEYFGKYDVGILVDGKQIQSIENLLKAFSYYDEMKGHELYSDVGSKFKISFELLSEGEERFIDTITKIKDCIYKNNNAKLLVLLFDEPDQALHPEWSRRFVDIITQVLESLEFEGDIQLIMSTHSPYLLSDILPEDVILLKRDAENRMLNVHRLNGNNEVSFGANIYDLMKNDFFMTNTVGEFATKKIHYFMKKINRIKDNCENIQEIECFIDKIGEPILQKVMRKQLEEKRIKMQMTKHKEGILEMIRDDKDRERVKEYLLMLEE